MTRKITLAQAHDLLGELEMRLFDAEDRDRTAMAKKLRTQRDKLLSLIERMEQLDAERSEWSRLFGTPEMLGCATHQGGGR